MAGLVDDLCGLRPVSAHGPQARSPSRYAPQYVALQSVLQSPLQGALKSTHVPARSKALTAPTCAAFIGSRRCAPSPVRSPSP